MTEPAVKRIAMWSGPRNISTALMRSFENREDCVVVDEPLYGYYLAHTGFQHPAGEEIVAAMDCDWRSVTDALCHRLPPWAGQPAPTVYYQKHMTQHLLPEVDLAFCDTLHNCFLIREPRRIIASYARVRPDFSLDELGFARQWELFQRVADRTGRAPVVIDSAQTLRAPERTLRLLCQHLAIPFSRRMLQWPTGRRVSDGVWAPHWYASVEASTGFESPAAEASVEVAIPARYETLCAQAERFYAELYRHALVRAQ